MQVFNVQGMTCGHCVKGVTRAVQEQDAAAQVEVDLAARQVRVQSALAWSRSSRRFATRAIRPSWPDDGLIL